MLTSEQIALGFSSILSGNASDAQIGAFLMALEMKGISSDDIYTGAAVMRANMLPVKLPRAIQANAIDIVGTGGTGLNTVSISTATAIVVAAAGGTVAKHGNRAASSLAGTADTLSELGVNLDISPELAAKSIKDIGLGFLFAPNHHPAMRHVAAARKALGIRTIFNLLGPLSNPAGVKRMLLGVSQDSFRRPMAEAVSKLGVKKAWVVHGSDGLDEITITGPTFVSEVTPDGIQDFIIQPQDYGFEPQPLSELSGGNGALNAAALRELLDGKAGAYRDIVLLNSGAALMLAGVSDSVADGIELSRQALQSGRARQLLQDLVDMTNG